MTGLTLELYATKEELEKAQKDPAGAIITAYPKFSEHCPKEAVYHIAALLDICELKEDGTVMVNATEDAYTELSRRTTERTLEKIMASGDFPVAFGDIQ